MMRISRFLPDFISQTGNTQVSFITRDYPNIKMLDKKDIKLSS